MIKCSNSSQLCELITTPYPFWNGYERKSGSKSPKLLIVINRGVTVGRSD